MAPLAYKIISYDALEIVFDKLEIGHDELPRLPDPICLPPDAPYRFKLRLMNYGSIATTNETVIRLIVVGNNVSYESEEIYLGIMWHGESMLLGGPAEPSTSPRTNPDQSTTM